MHKKYRILLTVAATLALCGGGCPRMPWQREVVVEAPKPARPRIDEGTRNRTEFWNTVSDGVEREVLSVGDPQVNVTMYRMDPKMFEVHLLSDTIAPKSVVAWAKLVQGDSVVINGAYFNEDNSPSGFMAIDGVRVGTRQFDFDKSGLAVFAPQLRIIDTKQTPTDYDAAALGSAVQSYPFLIADGKPAIQEDSGQLSRRTFIGIDQAGKMYIGSVNDTVVSLYGLMNILAKSDMHFTYVLNLDGGTSAGYAFTTKGVTLAFDSFSPVPNAIAFVRKGSWQAPAPTEVPEQTGVPAGAPPAAP